MIDASAWPAGATVRPNERLARHVACRCGGPCDAFVVVDEREALPAVLAAIKEHRAVTRVLGAGTRTAFRSAGVTGVVLRLGRGFSNIVPEGSLWEVGAAVPVPALMSATIRAGATGVEGLGGVPGSMGAAVALDEGPWTERVVEVAYATASRLKRGTLDEVRGRVAAGKPCVITSVTLRLDDAEEGTVRQRVDDALAAAPSPWFEGSQVAGLVRRAGLAGVRVRAVSVPAAAPAVLVAAAPGQADDLELLTRSVIDRVRLRTGITMKARVRWEGRRQKRPDGRRPGRAGIRRRG